LNHASHVILLPCYLLEIRHSQSSLVMQNTLVISFTSSSNS